MSELQELLNYAEENWVLFTSVIGSLIATAIWNWPRMLFKFLTKKTISKRGNTEQKTGPTGDSSFVNQGNHTGDNNFHNSFNAQVQPKEKKYFLA